MYTQASSVTSLWHAHVISVTGQMMDFIKIDSLNKGWLHKRNLRLRPLLNIHGIRAVVSVLNASSFENKATGNSIVSLDSDT